MRSSSPLFRPASTTGIFFAACAFGLPLLARAQTAAPPADTIIRHSSGKFEIALDEVAVIEGGEWQAKNLRATKSGKELRDAAKNLSAKAGKPVRPVVYQKGAKHTWANQMFITGELEVALAEGVDPRQIAHDHGLKFIGKGDTVVGTMAFGCAKDADALAAVEALKKDARVRFADPVILPRYTTQAIPNDTLVGKQWHLRNSGQEGGVPNGDVNVSPIWGNFALANDGIRGRGVLVGIVDSGIDSNNPDLRSKLISSGISYHRADPLSDTSDPVSDPLGDPVPANDPGEAHGTAVAGIVAAETNNRAGVAGVAPAAKLISLRFPFADQFSAKIPAKLMLEASDTSFSPVHVKNNSWGNSAFQVTRSPYFHAALAKSTREARNGLGLISVKSAGNDRLQLGDANYEDFSNSRYVVTVGAMGDVAPPLLPTRDHITDYSNWGECLSVIAPGGTTWWQSKTPRGLQTQPGVSKTCASITTTDGSWLFNRNIGGAAIWDAGFNDGQGGVHNAGAAPDYADWDYTNSMNGTSAAAPCVAGVVALMLEANPTLSWRDVQDILQRSAKNHLGHTFADPLLIARYEPNGNYILDSDDPVLDPDPDKDWKLNRARPLLSMPPGFKTAPTSNGLWFNKKYGFGLVDASAACYLAQNWINLPVAFDTLQTLIIDSYKDLKDDISGPVFLAPRGSGAASAMSQPGLKAFAGQQMFTVTNGARANVASASGLSNPASGTSISLPVSLTNWRTEHVCLQFDRVKTTSRGDLRITIVSPGGTVSVVHDIHADASEDVQWTYTSRRFWGEDPNGNWTVYVADLSSAPNGEPATDTGTAVINPAPDDVAVDPQNPLVRLHICGYINPSFRPALTTPSGTAAAPDPLRTAVVGRTFAQSIIANAAINQRPTVFKVTGLPPGLSLAPYTPFPGGEYPASRTISGIPTVPGVYDVTVVASNVLGSDTKFMRITVEDPYISWADKAGLTAANRGDNLDPDGDGFTNAMEYALGLIPTVADPSSKGPLTGTNPLTISFTRIPSRSEVTYEVQVSTDLVNWTPIAVSANGNPVSVVTGQVGKYSAGEVVVTPPTDPPSSRATVTDLTPSVKKYFRLQVTVRHI